MKEITASEFATEYPHHKAGGPAFPFVSGDMTMYGMSIRDYFAGIAMQALIEKYDCEPKGETAMEAYEYADAMLAERDK